MQEIFGGDNTEIERKEELLSRIFDEIASQDLGGDSKEIKVRTDHFSSSPEVTKTISIQRLLSDEGLQQTTFKALGIEERPRDVEDRHLILGQEGHTFKRITLHVYPSENGIIYDNYNSQLIQAEDDKLQEFKETAQETYDTLSEIVKRLER